MRLSNNTIAILKNYAEINSNLVINPGNVLKTIHTPPTIYACATVEEVFDNTFGIYDLKEFLATLAMFKNPDLKFNDQYVEIVDLDDNTINTKYWSADTSILTNVPQLKEFPQPQATFDISATNFKRIQRAALTLNCNDVVLEGNRDGIFVVICDLQINTKNKNKCTIKVSDTNNFGEFSVHLKQDKLMIIDGNYRCDIIANQLIKLTHSTKKVEYVITLDV